MRNKRMLTGFLGFLCMLTAVFQVSAGDYYFDDVSVVPMDSERVVHAQRVVVSEGKIIALGPKEGIAVPAGAQRIDARDGFLMPGLAEMHAHVPSRDRGEQIARDVLTLYLANGITTIRGMLGEPWHIELREALAKGDYLGPRLFTSGPSFNGRSVSSPAQASRMVKAQAVAGYDFLKLHPGLKEAEYRAIVTAATELEIPYAGHVSNDVGISLTLTSEQATIDHLDGYAQALVAADHELYGAAPDFFGINLSRGMRLAAVPALAVSTAKAGVWNVPTQSLLENILYSQSIDELMGRPEMAYMKKATTEDWRKRVQAFRAEISKEDAAHYLEVRRRLIQQLQVHGGGLLLGSDAPQMMNVPGFSLHEELAYLVNAGLSPYEALATGTTNVARFLGDEHNGQVAVGMQANLVLLDANPLLDIAHTRHPRGVMLLGTWLDRSALDKKLLAIKARKI